MPRPYPEEPRPHGPRSHGRPDADRRVAQRALSAGLLVAVVIAVPSAVLLVAADAARLAPAAVLAAATLGLLVAAGWVLVSVAVDVLAGQRPSGRRVAVGLALAAAGFVAPVLVLAALAAA